MSYYPPYKSSSNNVKVELDLTNYATKTDLKNITHVDVSSFASKTNLAALKTEVDKIDADKLMAVPVDLAKFSNVVKNEVVKKTDYITKKIPDINGLATKTSLNDYLQTSTFNSRVTEVENKIKANDTLAKSANTKANTIRSDLTGYAKKADVATDITLIKNNYVTNANLTSQLNNLKSQHVTDEVKKVEDKINENKKEITFV